MEIFEQSAVTAELEDFEIVGRMRPGDAIAIPDATLQVRPLVLHELLAMGTAAGKHLGAYYHADEAVYEVFCRAVRVGGGSRSHKELSLNPAYLFDRQLLTLVRVLIACVKSDDNFLKAYGNADADAERDVVAYSALSRRVISLKEFKHSRVNATGDLNRCLDYLTRQDAIQTTTKVNKSSARAYRLNIAELLKTQVLLHNRVREAEAEAEVEDGETEQE